jgi:hypothetical protein
LKIARHHCRPVDLGEFANSPNNHLRDIGLQTRFAHLCDVFERVFSAAMARAQSSCLQGDAVCDTVKPRPDSILRPHVGSPSSEDEEHCLEGILSILSVPQNPVTHSKNKWPVTIDEFLECRLAPAKVSGEQLSIGFAREIRNETSQAAEDQIHPLPLFTSAKRQLSKLQLPP